MNFVVSRPTMAARQVTASYESRNADMITASRRLRTVADGSSQQGSAARLERDPQRLDESPLARSRAGNCL
jgi:hypothetical protein